MWESRRDFQRVGSQASSAFHAFRLFIDPANLLEGAPHPATIAAWIAKQSAANSIDPTDIEVDLYQTFLNAKHNAASKAAGASTVEENATHCGEAKSLLTMTEEFLGLPEMFTPERFGKLYEQSLYWIAFRVNPADGELRNAERNLLLTLVDRASDDDAPAMLEALNPMDPWAFGPEDADTMRLKKELRDEWVARLLPKVENAFPPYLNRPESLRLLSTSGGSSSFRYVLFSPDRLPGGRPFRAPQLKELAWSVGRLVQAILDEWQFEWQAR
jgi:hypothetical protein